MELNLLKKSLSDSLFEDYLKTPYQVPQTIVNIARKSKFVSATEELMLDRDYVTRRLGLMLAKEERQVKTYKDSWIRVTGKICHTLSTGTGELWISTSHQASGWKSKTL